jgi:hypothetical protein
MALRFTLRGFAAGGALVLTGLALTACGGDNSVSAGGPLPDETTTTTAPTDTTVPPVAETVVPDTTEQILPPDVGATSTLPCEQDPLRDAAVSKYGQAEGFLVTDCAGDWASGSTRHEFDAPLEILFRAEDGAWVAVDRGGEMCKRQNVPDDVARQLGCVV